MALVWFAVQLVMYAFLGAIPLVAVGIVPQGGPYEWWMYVLAVPLGYAMLAGAMILAGRTRKSPPPMDEGRAARKG